MIVERKFVTPCKKEPFRASIFIVGEPGMVEPNKNVYRKPPTKTNYFKVFLDMAFITSIKLYLGRSSFEQTQVN
ncbi:uncharacterized protein METZ01_LOCUS187002 [marine metagenome]|uniref:Uncharacterized protein n=1 Tax=marine metagenome TaxID=408172 RepID=A0A382D6T1_9ZZZZ